MSEDGLDLSVPHLRLVSLHHSPSVVSSRGTHTLPGYFVVRGSVAPDGRMMIRWDPNAALGQASHQMQLPRTDTASEDPLYGMDTNHPMQLEDHGALLEQADPRYAYLLLEIEVPNPTEAV